MTCTCNTDAWPHATTDAWPGLHACPVVAVIIPSHSILWASLESIYIHVLPHVHWVLWTLYALLRCGVVSVDTKPVLDVLQRWLIVGVLLLTMMIQIYI